MKSIIKKILRPLANFMRKITFKLHRDVISDVGRTESPSNGLIPYDNEEYIRIMFLFQAASFWPGWESFYRECVKDERIHVKFMLLDELYGDTTQMLTARQFLTEKNIPYEVYTKKKFSIFSPHVLVMQTPYDYGHRSPSVRSAAFKKTGTRIMYIPYGIELADTEHARDAHFFNAVVRNAWRVFTFSERMREDYRFYCPNYRAVKCVGHPKFDALCHREELTLPPKLQQRIKGRKVLIWHVHFPKLVPQPDGSETMATPKLEVYLEFAQYVLGRKEDLFVILLPHPKFMDGEGELGVKAKRLVDQLSDAENVYVDWADDYRPTLVNGDYMITDRSALMVEAGITGMPILYMYNSDYYEPLTEAIRPIMESYYQGTTCLEMQKFVAQCLAGGDPRKEERIRSFQENIGFLDGRSGWRIKEHIVQALQDENKDEALEKIVAMETKIAMLEDKIDRLLEQRVSAGEERKI